MSNQSPEIPFGFSQEGLERVQFSYALGDALKLIFRRLDMAMKDIGLTQSQWRTLVQIFRLNEPTQSELAKNMVIGRAAAGVFVDKLVESGYVTRKADPSDRRVWKIVPTQKALKQSTKIAAITEQTTEEIFRNVSQKELQDVMHILGRLEA